MKTNPNLYYTLKEITPIIGLITNILLIFYILYLNPSILEGYGIYNEKIDSEIIESLLLLLLVGLLGSPLIISAIILNILESKIKDLEEIERKKEFFETDNIISLTTMNKIEYEKEVLNIINSKLTYGGLSKFDSATEYKISIDHHRSSGPYVLVDCIVDNELVITSILNPKNLTISIDKDEKENQLLTITGGLILQRHPNKTFEYPIKKIRIVLFKSDEDIEILKKELLNLIKITNAPYRDF
ncbi:hypothetical protein ACFQ5N_01035 [Lutibacter holmesii]|uniref:Uncharacterized protein n=1 Tax=Lutibacter holmesii TaxID=1137985 RepID=A0ABW3WJC8_9FLAO